MDFTKLTPEQLNKMDKQVDQMHQITLFEVFTTQSTTRGGLQYCINQEQFRRVFLDNGDVPMDNNLAEQAIRPFTIGRKNWVCANSINGARASAVLYSIVETAKANDFKVYD